MSEPAVRCHHVVNRRPCHRLASPLPPLQPSRALCLTSAQLWSIDPPSRTHLPADRDPNEARQLLDSVIKVTVAAVLRDEGTGHQVMGDGTIALFGRDLKDAL